jgi:glycogen synthase
VAVWRDKTHWCQLQRNAMAGRYDWSTPAQRYLDLYRHLKKS